MSLPFYAPNQPLERTAHPAGFFWLFRHHRGWTAAHRQRCYDFPCQGVFL